VTGAVWRVLPDVPAIDRVFDYRAPPGEPVPVGTIVRVPLHGRRVRGWVLEVGTASDVPDAELRVAHAVVSAGPPAPLVELCRWAAWRWAGPLATFLRAASPKNVVAPHSTPREPDVAVHPPRVAPLPLPDGDAPLLVVWPPARDRTPLVLARLAPEGSTIVVVPDRAEQHRLAAAARDEGRTVLELRGDGREDLRTAAWQDARRGACVVIGGRVAVFAPVPDLQSVVILDDADDALVAETAPTWHARDLAAERARRVDARLTIVTPAPTVDAGELAPRVAALPDATGRAGWPLVEVVDRRAEPPGLGLLGERLAAALHTVLGEDRRAVCVLNRRGRARLLICRQCGLPARCEGCGAAMTEEDGVLVCPRGDSTRPRVCVECGSTRLRAARPGVRRLRDDLAALLPRASVTVAERGVDPDDTADVVVGTEAALHLVDGTRPVGLVAFLDFDQELLAPRFRADEQALWLLVRAARLCGDRRSGARVLVQTRVPDHEVLAAARTGDPMPVVAADRDRRRTLGFPPFGGLAALAGDPDAVATAVSIVRDHVPVLGPTDGRALLRAPTPGALADALAAVDLAPARAHGRLRVEVDPQRV
jgi:primosomal protein N' (replication factor Y) (superfamily II helicase)